MTPMASSSRFHGYGIQILVVLLIFIALGGQVLAANCPASSTYTDNGSNSNHTLGSGQTLKIASGTYTGTVEFGSGASICVEAGATFAPTNLNNTAGTLLNYGTANLQTFAYNTGTVIDNYGTLSFLGGLNTNGATTFRNRANATMNMATSFQLGNGSTFINDGLLVAQQDFNTQNGTTLTNNHRLELNGNFNPDGKFDNYGRVYAKAFMNINANSDVSNHCTLVSWGGFNNNSPVMDNQGTILITTAAGTPGGPWQNNQAFQNGTNARIAGGNFINNSTFTGGGFMIFAGDTRNQGAFNGNSAADKLTFYDETQTAAQIFDVIGVVPTNTVRAAFTRPTELDAPSNCSASYKNFANPVVDDYGDAPATYGDANHTIVSGIHMGTLAPDAESASQYSLNAMGDGTEEDGAPRPPTGPADGSRFPVLKMTDTSYSLPVTVNNTTGAAGQLYGWIDFDKSGTFEADEATSVAVANGASATVVTLNWASIPLDIKLGTTYIRLRLTTDASVTTSTPTGTANNGEAEDYTIAIYQHIPPDSPSLSVISGADPNTCQSSVFTDNFNDLGNFNWGQHVAARQDIRNWDISGGGTDTYADTHTEIPVQQASVYMGNGAIRGISPKFPNGFTFDANGHLTSVVDAIALRDVPDDIPPLTNSHWGPEPMRLARTFVTQAGKKYRLFFKAIPEQSTFVPGMMRVDAPGGSIHFKAPGSSEGIQNYAIEFTATSASSTIAFVNYGHMSSDWCDPQTSEWCTTDGVTNGTAPNELIIDDVVVAAVDNCDIGGISGTVYADTNGNNAYDSATESGLTNITVTLSDNTSNAILGTASTAANGSYGFTALPVSQTYRITVDTADVDLPPNFFIGTPHPLTGVVVSQGLTTSNQNFGFDNVTIPPTTWMTQRVIDDCYGTSSYTPTGNAENAPCQSYTQDIYENWDPSVAGSGDTDIQQCRLGYEESSGQYYFGYPLKAGQSETVPRI